MDVQRMYWRCENCDLVFVDKANLLSIGDEKRIYDCHQNDPSDLRYRTFLSRLWLPLSQRIPPKSTGLDFGCGPGPTLSEMAEEQGFCMSIFDPIYFPISTALQQQYSFVTATEVVEHIYWPGVTLRKLWAIIQPNGYLAVMTKLREESTVFAQWHYKNDPTHVRFYSRNTFNCLAEEYNASLEVIGDDIIFLKKSA